MNARPTITLRAELSGDSTATAVGMTVESATPLLAICRALVDAGHDPCTPLQAWRGDQFALVISAIGEAAELEVGGRSVGFVKRRAPVSNAPPIAPNDQPATEHQGQAAPAADYPPRHQQQRRTNR